ncbi:hypothetical protein [Actinophytocola sp.]|uniref:hypothetical protein n=1 Tax=Actinophytocola sp. TaxID=1872138 RepID=UPI002D7E8FB8|nr:hypothetical protein [Actinophytocola sp.]HET9138607.1 hypothetical protein [Actinophytocola sp.]HEU5109587.1 hypothetical protein [Micromonosporaceae bacterium]
MAEPITDRHVVAVLRPFVRATTPMLTALRDSDPLGLLRRVLPDGGAEQEAAEVGGLRQKMREGLENMRVPGTAAWGRMTVTDRDEWWVNRVGRFTVLLAALPGLAGAIADRVPLQDTLALAGQGLLLCAIAAEHGVTDPAERVRLLAAVLFERDIDPALARRADDTEERQTAELTEDLSKSSARHGRVTLRAAGRTMWRFGRTLWALGDELDKRPQGRFYHRALGLLPVVGMAGDYLGERSALKRAAKAGKKWLAAAA